MVVASLSRFEDPCKTSLSIPPHFRLGQSLRISPPIGFVDLSSSLVFRLVRRYSRYPFFVVPFRLVSFGSSSLSFSRLVVVFSSSFSTVYSTSFHLSPLFSVSLASSVSSFFFGCRSSSIQHASSLFSVSSFVSSLLALSIPVLSSVVSSLFSSCLLRSFYGSTRLSYPYPHRSRLSFLFSPTDYLGSTRPPFIHLRSHALRVLFLHSSFHLVCCYRHPF